MFARCFALSGPVARGRLYATAHGIYEASLNGRRVGDAYLTPGWTDYHKILQVQYYDATELLCPEGENTLTLTVADGWYKGPLSWDCIPDRYGDRTGVWAELRVTYADGRTASIVTHRGRPQHIVLFAVDLPAKSVMASKNIRSVPEHMGFSIRDIFPGWEVGVGNDMLHIASPPFLLSYPDASDHPYRDPRPSRHTWLSGRQPGFSRSRRSRSMASRGMSN